ncbi:VOC family protein [Streptomyces brasiliensis]|uniref:VOC family protein n=1 Tax=Streptomyces brasiliensis TaxID=1954 RepID=UPI0027E540AE|nr:VOC family protein [Streptomyces brasiliensis]
MDSDVVRCHRRLSRPWKLAEFYAGLLGWEISTDISTEDWGNLRTDDVELSFQRVENYQRPSRPGQEHPQQFHLDFEVDEFEPEQCRVIKLGATLQKSFAGESGYGCRSTSTRPGIRSACAATLPSPDRTR